MRAFHRTARDSRILMFVGLTVALIISMIFMLLGFHTLLEHGIIKTEIIFGIVGFALFILFIRGAWMITGKTKVHVFSIDQDKITWGFIGNEKVIKIKDIQRIYWDDSDGLSLQMTTTEGQQIRFMYIESVVKYKSRSELLKFIKANMSHIPLDGIFFKNKRSGMNDYT